MGYSDKFKDPRWQKKRLEILQRDGWACQRCGNPDSTLHIHHRYYEKDLEPWDYDSGSLITLCEECHQSETECIESAIDSLVCAAKMQFFSADIVQIATGLRFQKIYHVAEVAASIIEWGLQDKTICELMKEEYFAHLRTRQEGIKK